jgi:hypothetical protein
MPPFDRDGIVNDLKLRDDIARDAMRELIHKWSERQNLDLRLAWVALTAYQLADEMMAARRSMRDVPERENPPRNFDHDRR